MKNMLHSFFLIRWGIIHGYKALIKQLSHDTTLKYNVPKRIQIIRIAAQTDVFRKSSVIEGNILVVVYFWYYFVLSLVLNAALEMGFVNLHFPCVLYDDMKFDSVTIMLRCNQEETGGVRACFYPGGRQIKTWEVWVLDCLKQRP